MSTTSRNQATSLKAERAVDTIFVRNEFGDYTHLNCKGASKLMKMVADNVDWDDSVKDGKNRGQSALSNVQSPL